MNNYEYTVASDIEIYNQNGGTYIIPNEVVNRMLCELEEMNEEIKELNNSVTWWKNRYEAQVKINEELKHDRYNKKVSRSNKYSE